MLSARVPSDSPEERNILFTAAERRDILSKWLELRRLKIFNSMDDRCELEL